MHAFASPPPLAAVRDEVLSDGHLWLCEDVAGAPLRFALDGAGLLHFGDAERTFDARATPLGHRFAVRAVRESFDRDGFRAAVDAPNAYTFLCLATRFRGVPYDFDRLPPVVGVAIVGPDGRLPVDRTTAAFDRLGLATLPVVGKEVRVRDFRPERFAWPSSAWYDGPAAGVVVYNRSGSWARYVRPEAAPERTVAPLDDSDPATLARRLATPDRIAAAAGVDAPADGDATVADAAGADALDVEAIAIRVVDAVVRAEWGRLDATPGLDVDALAAAIEERVRTRLGGGA